MTPTVWRALWCALFTVALMVAITSVPAAARPGPFDGCRLVVFVGHDFVCVPHRPAPSFLLIHPR